MYTEEIQRLSQEIHKDLIQLRRTLHQYPELAFEEYRTAALISGYLEKLGIEVRTGVAKTGVVGLIRGRNAEKTVALRADMDALPIVEESDCEYRSTIPGKMHACGHDAHVACLLGAANILNHLRNHVDGNVKLIFQPAEEGVGGALPMIEEGVLAQPTVNACAAAHVFPEVPAGTIEVLNGPVMASVDMFEITIKGRGGHGAIPHSAIDPIVIACQVVTALQSIVSRRVSPLDPAVISVCYFHSGTFTNIIPDTAVLKGTARTLSPALRKEIRSLIEETATGIVKALGGQCEISYTHLYPATVNDDAVTRQLADSASKVLGPENVRFGREPSMGGEDFSYFAERVSATFFRLGCGNRKREIIHPIHNSRFTIDEDCLRVGSAVLAQFAVDYLTGG